MKKNIKIVRLTTGEDLIGEVQEGSGIVNIKETLHNLPNFSNLNS